ncbi:HAMP domain-containing histidine kinase [Aureisphaera sp. CAU 1614]|uniref:histidine kinase n=1 Tax=Halomarinibacterium sedimenti TaxID=2857106 RepID=A0A9X1JZP8_9FLAO|nr:HAMP domain-containing sensor histidine kinase [Halomarinibacterium sedimenti]MBW2938687.1 HAMP domain-containing histidine kinase [Halomarinibacterium sedimenti]
MITSKNRSHWVKFGVIILGVLFFIFFLDTKFKENEKIARAERLESVHNHMLNQFSFSIDNFAGLVSGMNSFVNLSKELPSAEEFQEFVRIQFRDINRQDSIVVSFIDTAHVFKFSFTPNQMDPANLIGKKVASIRDDKEIKNLNRLLTKDGLHLFPAINLVEGWPGLPLNFRVYRDGKVLGYVAPIIDFKSIIQPIYDDIEYDEFVFLFKNEDGQDFDRQQVYDGTKVYNTSKDTEYYKNFHINSNNFLISKKTYFGYSLTLGTAYKDDFKPDNKFYIILWTSYFAFVILGLVITLQVDRYKRLNDKLAFTNNLLEERQIKINQQNKELIQLNKTKDKFFSIIGHDIKQPLNAIEGLLHLLEDSEIQDPDLKEILVNLNQATGNTVDLLNNLLRWALSQTGEINFNPTNLNLTQLINESLRILKFQADLKQIIIKDSLVENIIFYCDGDMIQTVVRNLVSNAIKYSNEGGIVEVILLKEKTELVLKIKDYGVGMSQKQVDSLFKLDNLTSTLGTKGEMGTGLGLQLAKDFVKKHQGIIIVESSIGNGTTFIVKFPLL